MRRRHPFLHAVFALLAAALLGSPLAVPQADAAELYLVVNAANPLRSLSQREAVALFTGRTRSYPNGDPARPFDQPRDSPAREAFYMALTGMDLARINSYWARLLFSGQVLPPTVVRNDVEMVESIKQRADALGYLSSAPSDPALRVVLVLKEATP